MMKIDSCCVDLLKGWTWQSVYDVKDLILTCRNCKQKWEMKKSDHRHERITWKKIKEPKEPKNEI